MLCVPLFCVIVGLPDKIQDSKLNLNFRNIFSEIYKIYTKNIFIIYFEYINIFEYMLYKYVTGKVWDILILKSTPLFI